VRGRDPVAGNSAGWAQVDITPRLGLPMGGYEVVQANTYSVTGPAPLAPGLNGRVRARFLDLVDCLSCAS
jgi:hypothetical protein